MNKTALYLSASLLLLLALAGALAPWLAPYPESAQDIAARLQDSSASHWLGTDSLGRDLFSRIIFGARTSLAVGVVTAGFALGIGTATGAWAGYRGGWIDLVLLRIVDFFSIFPSLLLAILVTLILGKGLVGICLAIGLTSWMAQARLVRGLVLQARAQTYVEAAIAAGARDTRVLFKQILPNLWGPLLVNLSFQIPSNILAESFLSFLGLGLQPPQSSWGTLANEGFRAMRSYPYLMIYPGIVLFACLAAFNVLSDALGEARGIGPAYGR